MTTRKTVHPDRRRLHRRAIALPIVLSGSSLGKRRRGAVTDLTMLGCRIVAPGRYNKGDFLMVVAPSFGPFGAVVAWAAEGQLGVEFTPPIHQAVVDHIVSLKPPDCPIERRWRGETV